MRLHVLTQYWHVLRPGEIPLQEVNQNVDQGLKVILRAKLASHQLVVRGKERCTLECIVNFLSLILVKGESKIYQCDSV